MVVNMDPFLYFVVFITCLTSDVQICVSFVNNVSIEKNKIMKKKLYLCVC